MTSQVVSSLETVLVTFWQNVGIFCSCPKNQPKDKLKSFRLMLLTEEILRLTRLTIQTDLVWLLVIILMQIYNEKKQTQKRDT